METNILVFKGKEEFNEYLIGKRIINVFYTGGHGYWKVENNLNVNLKTTFVTRKKSNKPTYNVSIDWFFSKGMYVKL